MIVGQEIKAARKNANMTQRELAQKMGLSFQSIAQWENGLRNPKIETLKKIADALECPVDTFTADDLSDMLGYEETDIDRSFAPAGKLIDPEQAAQVVKDSVDRGTPTREIATASRYLMLAAMSICTDSMNAFEHYLDASEDYQRENAEYMVLDGRKAAAQIQSILGVMSELEGLEEH